MWVPDATIGLKWSSGSLKYKKHQINLYSTLMAITRCRRIYRGASRRNACKHIHKTAAGDQPVQPSIGSLVAFPFPNKLRQLLKWNKQRQRAKRTVGKRMVCMFVFELVGGLERNKEKELWIKTCHDGNIHDILQFSVRIKGQSGM